MHKLTDRQFWINYWENKTDLIQYVDRKNYFSPLFKKIFRDNPTIKKSLEIGGFPGHLSIYLKKYYDIEPTLLDYIIHKELVEELLRFNKMKTIDLNLIEADLFATKGSAVYDLTYSSGFIEHFSDTKGLIQYHADFTKPGGIVFISVPNFLGFNGWVNKNFDYSVFKKHYLKCMNKHYLKECASNCNLINIETFYFGKFSIWLENIKTKNVLFRILFKIIWFLGKALTTIFPFEKKILSPYTILYAQKEKNESSINK